MTLETLALAAVAAATAWKAGTVTVPEGSVWLVSRLGRHRKVLRPGLHFRIPLADRVARKLSMAAREIRGTVSVWLAADVVEVPVSILIRATPGKEYEAAYALADPDAAILAFVADRVTRLVEAEGGERKLLSSQTLEAEVARPVREEIATHGHELVRVLLNDSAIR